MRDYYEILNVDKNASEQELKKAYRKIAMKNHPDRNPGDKNAERIFKEAAEAYSVLSDSQKRQQYDTFGHSGLNQAGQSGGFGGFNVEDIFNSVFGGGGGSGFGGFEDLFGSSRSRTKKTAGDLKLKLKLSLDEIYNGVTKKVRVKRKVRNGKESIKCSKCQGSGELRIVQRSMLGQIVNVQPCNNCSGIGYIGGTELSSSTIEINVPSGVSSGNYMTMKGKGNEGVDESLDGNLIIYFEEIEHEFFTRNDNDIYLESEIEYHQAILGDSIEVPTLSGNVSLKIPKSVKNQQILRLRGKGMKKINGNSCGDQYIRVTINIPKTISRKSHDLLIELSKEMGSRVSFKKINE
tara:strand:- start:295 stop:1344 length:1050 start_codon:yes stop_codon:yes gene_type:complete